ncbi:hypothetical protein NX862_00440 [Rhodobacter sp. KR11]|uniref:hypothetical protein n=1 Tax=Rhodobacter sp. KR11 TaxID=2974588 RepID=UPI00222146DC|nr:hypothetical protein [Rhodobacter sp. KR11]MCW1917214.1 hypothetical protein [Rhodobacter sp. KR11]
MTPEALVTGAHYDLLYLPGTTETLILACASIGHDPSRPPSPEWIRSTRPHPTAFLIDKTRSWGTAPGLAGTLARAPKYPRTLALGASMGGFLALQATHLLPIDAVIAMGPQHRPAARWEPRWRTLTADLPETLTAPKSQAARTYLLHAADDHQQALDFTEADHIYFPNQSHSTLAAHLKPALPGLIQAALTDRRHFLRLTAQAGGQRRPRGPDAYPRHSPDG